MPILIVLISLLVMAALTFALCRAASDGDDGFEELWEQEKEQLIKRKNARERMEKAAREQARREKPKEGAEPQADIERCDCINCPDRRECNCHYRRM